MNFEKFENTSGPNPLPSTIWSLSTGNWAVFDNGIGIIERWGINNSISTPPFVYNGSNSAYMTRENIGGGNTSEDYLATPAVTIPSNGQLRFYTRSFTSTTLGTLYQIKVKPVNSGVQNVATGYTLVKEWNESNLNATFNIYEEKTVDLSSYVGQQVYVAFVMKYSQPMVGTVPGDRWLIDNVIIDSNTCLSATALLANPSSSTSIDLSWTANGSTSWQIEYGVSGFVQGTGIIINTQNPNITINNLNPSTSYTFYIRAICGTNLSGVAQIQSSTLTECNTFLGDLAGNNSVGINNTFVGCETGLNSNGFGNTFLGFNAGKLQNGNGNIYIGKNTGYGLSGRGNIIMGNPILNSPIINTSLLLGEPVFLNSLTDNMLLIEKNNTNARTLGNNYIEGDFNKRIFQFNLNKTIDSKLIINSISGNSGLRFTGINSNSPTTIPSNGKVLTVDINGNVGLSAVSGGVNPNAVIQNEVYTIGSKVLTPISLIQNDSPTYHLVSYTPGDFLNNAIDNALNAGFKKIYIQEGEYFINNSINLSNINRAGITIEGAGINTYLHSSTGMSTSNPIFAISTEGNTIKNLAISTHNGINANEALASLKLTPGAQRNLFENLFLGRTVGGTFSDSIQIFVDINNNGEIDYNVFENIHFLKCRKSIVINVNGNNPVSAVFNHNIFNNFHLNGFTIGLEFTGTGGTIEGNLFSSFETQAVSSVSTFVVKGIRGVNNTFQNFNIADWNPPSPTQNFVFDVLNTANRTVIENTETENNGISNTNNKWYRDLGVGTQFINNANTNRVTDYIMNGLSDVVFRAAKFYPTENYRIQDFTNIVIKPLNSTPTIGKVLTSTDSIGTLTWATPITFGTDISLYANDGALSSNRIVTQNNNLLQFNTILNSNNNEPTFSIRKGKVFVGKTSTPYFNQTDLLDPSYNLIVNGKIRVKDEVLVQPSGIIWADYVFKTDYKLATLKEVENYIKMNGHLSNMPSAEEIEKNGLGLADMTKRQQEKIEELTLYIISQDKKFQSQEVELKRLKEEMELLKKIFNIKVENSKNEN
ncbi:hypothetical protein B0A58_13365 [Flavobacterium branchiophilum NBRC 15030 = ATCC 35035]|uniref:Fibronectin type-III domain-containing protein n=2 Tax=Flavobacterium branchiophilum TaxID=55197 RepID=A0A543G4I5_9FLAO|nr:hypothetical protein B0A58_13365 [Flavobacterium branchiophilum NBRC 15030 = ATCC 35035]TQM40979.1 hypothetical protein BC670_1908 [Flavobacterium branchiophilum]